MLADGMLLVISSGGKSTMWSTFVKDQFAVGYCAKAEMWSLTERILQPS